MSEVDSLGTAYYYSGVQNSTNEALKNRKTEKSDKTKKSNFADLLRSKDSEESAFKTVGLPPEIKEMTLEEAAVFLRDAVDMAGNDLQNNTSRENIDRFKKAVTQLISFVVQNNYEVTAKRSKRPQFTSPVGMFSTYNTTPRLKDPKVQVNIINQKLDALVQDSMRTQALQGNFKILQQVDEIKGLIVDLLSS